MSKNKLTLRNIPIFPLPNVVFFPKTFLPLHVFEPRYRKMIEQSEEHNQLIGVVLLKEGWENNYFGTPEVHEIACVGKIEQCEKLTDGKYNIMLYGLSKIKIKNFIQDEPYRIAQVEYLSERKIDPSEMNEEEEAKAFIQLVKKYLTEVGVENSHEIISIQKYSLESIINQIAAILDFSTTEKQELLEFDSLESRYLQLKSLINAQLQAIRIARHVKFVPKDPSLN